jgi:hypothetical protein
VLNTLEGVQEKVKVGWTSRSENRVWDPIITWEEKVEDEGNLTQEINLIKKKLDSEDACGRCHASSNPPLKLNLAPLYYIFTSIGIGITIFHRIYD